MTSLKINNLDLLNLINIRISELTSEENENKSISITNNNKTKNKENKNKENSSLINSIKIGEQLNKKSYQEQRLYDKDLDKIYEVMELFQSNKLNDKINKDIKNQKSLRKVNKIIYTKNRDYTTLKYISSIYNNKISKILDKILKTYNFKYHKKGEEASVKKTYNTVNSNNLKRKEKAHLTTNENTMIKKTFVNHLYNGIVFKDFKSYNKCNVQYAKKDTFGYDNNKNTRCISNNNDVLKIYSKLLNNVFINPIFKAGLVDTKVNSVKDCRVYSRNKKSGAKYEQLAFKNVATLSKEIVLSKDDFMLLDLSNAYNNVPYHTLYIILFEYLKKLELVSNNYSINKHLNKLDNDFKNKYTKTKSKKSNEYNESTESNHSENLGNLGNQTILNTLDASNTLDDSEYEKGEFDLNEKEHKPLNVDYSYLKKSLKKSSNNTNIFIHENYDYHDIKFHNEQTKKNKKENILAHNIAIGLVNIIRTIKYNDNILNQKLKRNKGIPQGNSMSCDIYVILMDYILKHTIIEIKKCFGLIHNIDYKFKTYVDDISLIFLSDKSYNFAKDLFYCIKTTMSRYYFKMNDNKTKCSQKIAQLTGFKGILPTDKYLGLYFEKDKLKYLKLIEKELIPKYGIKNKFTNKLTGKKEYMYSFQNIENNINKLTSYEKNSLRGKLQFRLHKFCNNPQDRFKFMKELGYPKIAELIFKNGSDLKESKSNNSN
jgi:hypothetical protein